MKYKTIFTSQFLKFIVIILFTITNHHSIAQKVTYDEAIQVAKNFLYEKGEIMKHNLIAPAGIQLEQEQGQTYYYTFNVNDKNSFVIVAADKRAYPILGYYTESGSNYSTQPPAFKAWMLMYEKQIDAAMSNNDIVDEDVLKQWERYQAPINDYNTRQLKSEPKVSLTTSSEESSSTNSIVGPLLGNISYDQLGFYDDHCPDEAPVGCVATAMSQIMVYYKHPNYGVGYREYIHGDDTLFADFGTTNYNVAQLPPFINSANPNVAKLCYHVGVSVLMEYSSSGSGSSNQDAVNALITNWDYDKNLTLKYKSDYTNVDEWEGMIRANIDAGIPLFYSGNDNKRGTAHAWVCDGYNAADNMFHMNWGWGGSYNGYFLLSALRPNIAKYSDDQAAIFGIKPNSSDVKTVVWEDFETDNNYYYLNEGWDTDADGDSITFDGYMFGYNDSYAKMGNGGEIEQWLVSPRIGLPADHTINLTFYTIRGNVTKNQSVDVYISTGGKDMKTDFTFIQSNLVTGFWNWNDHTVDLSAFSGEKVYVGLKASGYESGGNTDLYFDDILVEATPTVLATVTTQSITSIDATSAVANGNLSDLGNPNPSAYGFCWAKTGMPTISDSISNEGLATATGTFTSLLTNLSPNTYYNVRAYATNSAGTSYGELQSFTTTCNLVAEAIVGNNVQCFEGNDGSANATVTGGVSPYYYLWSNMATTDSISDLSIGTYSVTITGSNGCSDIDSVVITQPNEIIDTNIVYVCYGDDFTFPDDKTKYNVISDTTYTSSLKTVAGCDSTIITIIKVKEKYNVSEDVSVCFANDYVFPDGTTIKIAENITHISNLVSLSGCDSIITTNVFVKPIFDTIEEVKLCAGSDYTYPDGTTEIGIVTNTTHISNFLSVLGCDSTITTSITLNEVYDLSESVSLCYGSDYTYPDGTTETGITTSTSHINSFISILGCDSIITSNISINPVYNTTEEVNVCYGDDYTYPDGFVESGVVTKTTHISNLLTSSGCDSVITTKIKVNSVDVSVLVDGNYIKANNENANSFQWFDCNTGLPVQGETNSTFSPKKSGDYAVIKEELGCIDTSMCNAILIVGVNEKETQIQSIWPNPTTGKVYINLSGNNSSPEITISDVSGKVHWYKKIGIDERELAVDLPGKAGVYFVELKLNSEITTYKIIKK